jgi:hypothetical protein
MAKRYGATITRFRPYPVISDKRFAFAQIEYEGGEFTSSNLGLLSAAPQICNLMLYSALVAVLLFVTMPAWLFTILGAWAFVNWLDGGVAFATFYRRSQYEESPSWWPQYAPYTDGWKWQKAWGLSPWLCRVLAVVWHVGLLVLWLVSTNVL